MTTQEQKAKAAPVVESVTTRYYLITNHELGAEFTGAVIGNCDPVEAMRTMIGIVNDVSRETVTLNETKDRQGWVWSIEATLHYGTARFYR